MTTYAATQIPSEDQKLLYKIRHIMDILPDFDLGIGYFGEPRLLTCHAICRALADRYNLKCVDGLWNMCEHSWLITKNGNIIDAYPVGTIGGSILVPGKHIIWKRLYVENKDIMGIKSIHIESDVELIKSYLDNIKD